MILIFGAGSGIGNGLLETFQSLSTSYPKQGVAYGFSRRGTEAKPWKPFQNHKLDVTQERDLQEFASQWEKANIPTSEPLVIYFAQGNDAGGPVQSYSLESIRSHFEVQVFSLFSLLAIFQKTVAHRKTTVVFCNSTASRQGFAEATLYCAAKHASSGLAKALREEWKPFGTKVINAYLGAIATPIWDSRPDFPKEDMVTTEDACSFLASLSTLPETVYLDEVFLTPRKGIL